ncbi:hypothetical protein B0A54_17893 [Friedmanniomyces endolithicus]|uniref:Uncharacterized protein n=1 Tax=Friedmanniomyces endolithicus TaxID=329885 RepID=A0A4V5N538_9PEZI|nr:hypothetical protein B0A54_17893 [Friedmanniomyces endolithicus]
MRRSMPLWAVQGERFIRQNALWEQAQDNDGHTSLSQQTAKAFLENEAQTLEDRYRPSVDPAGSLLTKSDHTDIKRIEQRCLDFENLSFSSTALQEEQERELSPEIEQERQKPRPLATIDFARTIETSKSGPFAHMDAYQRPVQWILTAIRNGAIAHMLVISPFEAQELYSRIHASNTVALHLYTPRCNSGFRSLDRLDFYTVPHQVTAPTVPTRLVVQLNLFAGQLYINDYKDFRYLCGYLGLAAEVASEGWEIAWPGAIRRSGIDVNEESGQVFADANGCPEGRRELF